MKAFLAKDKNGSIYIYYDQKPRKDEEYGLWEGKAGHFIGFYENECPLLEGFNPQWEDEEPIEVNITITKAKNK